MISGINHVTIAVSNLDQCFAFYHEILGFKALAKRRKQSAYLLSWSDWIVLVQDENVEGLTSPKSYAHLAFSVAEGDLLKMSEKIRKSGADVWQENSSPGESLYFLDPSGNPREIHCGDWKSRLQWLKDIPTDEVILYEQKNRNAQMTYFSRAL